MTQTVISRVRDVCWCALTLAKHFKSIGIEHVLTRFMTDIKTEDDLESWIEAVKQTVHDSPPIEGVFGLARCPTCDGIMKSTMPLIRKEGRVMHSWCFTWKEQEADPDA